ncbi:MAG TPA: hypothetical protein VMF11_02545, partial [Candidatus Baltobacteraceae bacterium]|nr:hypothetical protein [Candidatus Baltobacteraceae bacterium]
AILGLVIVVSFRVDCFLQKQPSPKATVAALIYAARIVLSYTTAWDTIGFAAPRSRFLRLGTTRIH